MTQCTWHWNKQGAQHGHAGLRPLCRPDRSHPDRCRPVPSHPVGGGNLYQTILIDANLTRANLNRVHWQNTTCPDGSNSDTNGLNACAALP
jgi:uncharacterized protein YjbI with pentapeptide repeats